MRRITYIPSDMDAPGSYRCLFPGRQLKQNGVFDTMLPPHEIVAGPDGKRRFNFSISYKPPSPAAHIWVLQSRFERDLAEFGVQQLRQHGIATVFDVDDNYTELPAWNPAFWGTHPYRRDDGVVVNREARRRIKKQQGVAPPPNKTNRLHMFEAIKQVDAVTVSTPYLKDLYSAYNKNVHVVRNYVDWEMWEHIIPQYEVERWQGRIRVGYPGVFRYRRGDLEIIRPWIGKWVSQHPNVDFVANHPDVHDFLSIPHRQRIVVKEYDFLNIDTNEYAMPRKTATMDIGLIPLAPGGMSEAKSHLKGMELNAAGIPYIASNTESYRYFTKKAHRDINGFIADTPISWMDKLEYLVTMDDHRRGMGFIARQHAQDHSIQNNWQQWADVYENVLGDEFTALSRGAISRGAVQKVSELSGMLEMVKEINPKTVVEVGSARGGTFWALARASRSDALLASVDIPSGSPLDVREGRDVYGTRDRERMRSYVLEGQRCVLIDGNSQMESTLEKLIDSIGCEPVDVLFLDADHRYEGVKRDFQLYAPLVREGGLICFHDITTQNDPRSAVHIFWDELKNQCDMSHCIELIGEDAWGYGKWGGIGVLRKKAGELVYA